jgi:hypothetical protein
MRIFDYEYTTELPFLKPTLGVAPESIDDLQLAKCFRYGLRTYRGLKEDVYTATFHPDPSILAQLGVTTDEILVTVRPPATEAHYHNPEADRLFVEAVNVLGATAGVRMVILPRTVSSQGELIHRTWPRWCEERRIIVPDRALDGLNLVWFSDLVVSGGGTMNREAAALGVPVYSIFRGKLGAVDRYLAREGRLVLIEKPEEVRLKLNLVKRTRGAGPDFTERPALRQILNAAHELMELSKLEPLATHENPARSGGAPQVHEGGPCNERPRQRVRSDASPHRGGCAESERGTLHGNTPAKGAIAMNSHLILTVDYEVFGNGQGCLKHCVVEPTSRLLRVADQFDAPVTLFAEAAELIAMEREMGRGAVRDVREQLGGAVLGGHDVQLHLHPQWQGAKQRHDGGWDVDFDRWRIGDLPEHETESLISAGKGWLDDVAFANTAGRSCMAFRAGNWCIQPSEVVIRSLRRQGFRVESTVVPGMRRSSQGEWSDFRSAPDLPFWRVDGDVCEASLSGLWEVPIASGRVARLKQLFAELQARKTQNSRFAPNCHGSYSIRSGGPLNRVGVNLRKLIDLGLAKLDFSTMPAQILVTITEDWMRRFNDPLWPTPIVAIAHTKNWTDRSTGHLTDFLTWARSAGIRFSTYSEWLALLKTEATSNTTGSRPGEPERSDALLSAEA